MISVVIIHGDHILLAKDVAVSFDAQLLLHTFSDSTLSEEVNGILQSVASCSASPINALDVVVDNDPHASEVGNLVVGYPDATAALIGAGTVPAGGAGGGLNVTTNLTVDRDIDEARFRGMLETASTELVRVAQRELDRQRRAKGSARGGLIS